KQPGSDRDLVVAAAARVEFVTGRTNEFDQARFDETVDIFGPGIYGALEKIQTRGHLADLLQTVGDRLYLGFRQDSGPAEGARMDRARLQISEDQTSVNTETCVERREMFVGLAGEPAPPKIHRILFALVLISFPSA